MSLMRTSIPASYSPSPISKECFEDRREPAYPNTSIGSILDSFQERIIDRVKSHGEGAINNSAVYMCAKIHLHHITLLQHHLIPRIGCVMGSTVIDTQPTRETHPTLDIVPFLETLVTRQRAHGIFNTLCDLRQSLTRPDILLRILADLTVHLRALAVFLQEIIPHAVKIAFLLVGSAVGILILVFDNLTLGELVIGEEVGYWHARRRGLDLGTLLLLRLALLLLFGRCRLFLLVSRHFSGPSRR